jgi:hypothetical protein
MERITDREWGIVNAALALLEASLVDDFAGVELERVEARVARVREKVHQRVRGERDDLARDPNL